MAQVIAQIAKLKKHSERVFVQSYMLMDVKVYSLPKFQLSTILLQKLLKYTFRVNQSSIRSLLCSV